MDTRTKRAQSAVVQALTGVTMVTGCSSPGRGISRSVRRSVCGARPPPSSGASGAGWPGRGGRGHRERARRSRPDGTGGSASRAGAAGRLRGGSSSAPSAGRGGATAAPLWRRPARAPPAAREDEQPPPFPGLRRRCRELLGRPPPFCSLPSVQPPPVHRRRCQYSTAVPGLRARAAPTAGRAPLRLQPWVQVSTLSARQLWE